MKNETIERTWSKKEYQHTIGLATKAVEALLILKRKGVESTPKNVDLEFLTNCAIDDVVRVIWRLTEKKKEYKTFEREFLEATKKELES